MFTPCWSGVCRYYVVLFESVSRAGVYSAGSLATNRNISGRTEMDDFRATKRLDNIPITIAWTPYTYIRLSIAVKIARRRYIVCDAKLEAVIPHPFITGIGEIPIPIA